MLIREADETDLPGVLAVLKEMDGEEELDSGQALATWRKMKQYPYYKVFVAEDNQMIIGACSLIIIDNLGHEGSKIALAENVIVSSAFRGCGLGRRMMLFLMEQAKAEKCYKLMLSSNKKRVSAHKFYEQLGFKQHGISFLIELTPD